MMTRRPHSGARAAALVAIALVLVACTGKDKQAFEPLPATTAPSSLSTVATPSLPAGCGATGEMVTEVYSLGESMPDDTSSSVPTSDSDDGAGNDDGDSSPVTLAGGEEPALPGETDDTTVGSSIAADDSPAAPIDPNQLSIDIYTLQPECGPRPVVFWIHGGEWREGDKRDLLLEAAVAARHGWVLVAVNHRLAIDPSDDSEVSDGTGGTGGAMWPAMVDDIAAAIVHTISRAAGLGIDPARLAIVGHDSGAHLAALTATDPLVLAKAGASRDDIACTALLDPLGLSIPVLIDEAPIEVVDMVETVFGFDFTTYQRASPSIVLTQVEGQVADSLVVTYGDIERQAAAYDYADLVRATGAEAEVVLAAEYGDAEISDLWEVGENPTNVAVLNFLDRCLTTA